MKMIGLIPARSGSKRVAEKNVREFFGHPLMAYTIVTALKSGVFSKVFVSTDSENYARIARHYGADVSFLRPSEIAGERSTDAEWVEHTLKTFKTMGEAYDSFSILRPTSPFRTAQTIQRAFKEFISASDIDSLRAVEKCAQHPAKMWVQKETLITPLLEQDPLQPLHSRPYGTLPVVFVQNASLEMAVTRVIEEEHTIAGRRILPFFTQGYEGVDINEPYDLLYAEHLVRSGEVVLTPIAQKPLLQPSGV